MPIRGRSPSILTAQYLIFSFCILNVAFLTGCVPGTPEQRLKAGVAAFQRGDTAGAVRQFKGALRLDRNFAPAHYNLGVCYATPENRDRSIDHHRRAIAIDSGYADAYIALAQAYQRKDTLAAAIAVLRAGLDRGLSAERFHSNLGYCFLLSAEKDSAIAHYRRAIELNAYRDEYHFNVGYLLSAPAQADSSIKYLRRARQLSAEPVRVAYLLGCRLLDKPNRSRSEAAEGIALLREYLARGDGDPVKASKASEKLANAGVKQ